jgi:MscS family membrane protein
MKGYHLMIVTRCSLPCIFRNVVLAICTFLVVLNVLISSQLAAYAATELDSYPLRPADTSSPRDTLNSFLTYLDKAIKAWETGQAIEVRVRNFDRAASTFDTSRMSESDLRATELKAALLLKEILDRIALPPDDRIPGDDDIGSGADTLGHWTIPNTSISIARIAEGPRAGEYLFTADTLDHLEQYYEEAKDLPYNAGATPGIYANFIHSPGPVVPTSWGHALPRWTKTVILGEAVWQWLTLIIVLVLAFLLVRLLLILGRRWDTRHRDATASKRFGGPVAVLFGILVLIGTRLLLVYGAKLVGGYWIALSIGLWTLIFCGIGWFVFVTVGRVADVINDARRVTQGSIDAQLLRTLLHLASLLFLAFLVVYAADFFGIPVTPVLASLGVGGLAIALAVRPTLENVIGGLTLFADKPVRIGDYCRFGDDYGTVEEIGLRSTRLRKLDDTLVSIPNADFSQRELINFTRRRERLYRSTLGLRYETTPDQLRYVIARVKAMLSDHPRVSPRLLHVRFDGFGSSSLDIEVFAYVRTADWLEYRAIREDINLKIMDVVKEAGTGFAFPSQTAYVTRDIGIDEERARQAEAQVEVWRDKGELPFPSFDR